MDPVEDVAVERDHAYICKLISETFSEKVLDRLDQFKEERARAVAEETCFSDASEGGASDGGDDEARDSGQMDGVDAEEEEFFRKQR